MSFPRSETFSKLTENCRAVTKSVGQFERAHKQAIRAGQTDLVETLARAHYMHVGIYAESRLRVIVNDPTGFSQDERDRIWQKRSQGERWVKAVEEAAKRHYGISSLDVDLSGPDQRPLLQLKGVRALLQGSMASAIVDRNKLAHGQWTHQLKSHSENSFLQSPREVTRNYLEIVRQYSLISAISRLVSDLVVSRPTFERDFSATMQEVAGSSVPVSDLQYAEFAAMLRRRQKRANESRAGK